MSLPTILLGVLISSLYGAAFHLWRGGNAGRLFLYLVLAWVGFWIGHFAASLLDLTFASLGPLHLGMATVCSILALLIGYWLSLIQIERK